MSIEQFGWTPFWESRFHEFRAMGCDPARVLCVHRGGWELHASSGDQLARHLRAEIPPVTGDWIALHPNGESIEAVLPRLTSFRRRDPGSVHHDQILAANADILLIVMGLDGDFNLGRLERYLTLARMAAVDPVVVLNKSDAVPDPYLRQAQVERVAPGVPVSLLCALADSVEQVLAPHMERGRTAALIGSSGAGKSTILNRLMSSTAELTAAVHTSTSQGRHTTAWRRLHLTPQNWLVMDLPGLREVGIPGEDLPAGASPVRQRLSEAEAKRHGRIGSRAARAAKKLSKKP